MTDARHVHESAIVIDSVSPLSADGQYLDVYRDGGVTVVTPTVAMGGATASSAIRALGLWHRLFRTRPDLIQVRSGTDIRKAKETGSLGILLAFQGADAIEDDIDLIDAYKSLGVGVMQLTYNVENLLGYGCEEATDEGLTRLGRDAVARMNEANVVVDCSHTGYRTSMEAIEASQAPVIFSHSNAYAVHATPRNITDDLIRAAADTGGAIGGVGYPAFVSNKSQPSLDDMIDHVAYIADLVGIDHVGVGMDYFPGQDGIMPLADAQKMYELLLESGHWSPSSYPPPPYTFPEGIETPDLLPALTAGLLKRGFAVSEVKKIVGGNWLRVFEAVWD
jgi:membrane dipeptidase